MSTKSSTKEITSEVCVVVCKSQTRGLRPPQGSIPKLQYEHKFYPILNTAAHELVHNLIRLGNPYHVIPYGLMYSGDSFYVDFNGKKIPARRSYLNSTHIMDFRDGIPFDVLEY